MEHEVVVPLPPGAARRAVHEPAALARCLPGFAADATAPRETLAGRLKLRVGSSSITYRGELRLSEDDGDLVARLDARQSVGEGGVSGSLRVAVAPEGERAARLSFRCDLAGKGRIAELDPDAVRAAGRRLLDRFAAALATDPHALIGEQSAGPAAESIDGTDGGSPGTGEERRAGGAADPAAGTVPPDTAGGPQDGPADAEPVDGDRAERPPADAAKGAADQPGAAPADPADDPAVGPADEAAEELSVDENLAEALGGAVDEALGESLAEDGLDDVSGLAAEGRLPADPTGPAASGPGDSDLDGPDLDGPDLGGPGYGDAGLGDGDLDDAEPGEEPGEWPGTAPQRRALLGPSAEEVDHAPPRGRYAPALPARSARTRAAARWGGAESRLGEPPRPAARGLDAERARALVVGGAALVGGALLLARRLRRR